MEYSMVILDANVVLDFILARRDIKISIFNSETLAITPTSIVIVAYYAEKYKVLFDEVKKHLGTFNVLNFTQKTYNLAMEIANEKDFEDTQQIATALENKVDKFVTGDKNLAKKYEDLVEFVVV